MSTTYGDRPLRVTYTSSDSSGVAEFFDGSETGAIGITVPRFSTTERNNLTAGSVKQGMIIFNETDGKMQVYTVDAVGINIEAGAVGVRHAGTITGTATIAAGENIGLFGDVTFTGTVTVAGEMVVV